jgi:F-type H+-transporting ATPase subunit gamma
VGNKKRLLLLVITSDRGLCGGFNGNVIKATQRFVNQHQADYERIELAFLGRRGFDFFKTKKFTLGSNFSELSGKVTFAKAKKLSEALVGTYLSEEVDEVKVVYNEFKNAVTQMTLVEDFLPLRPVDVEREHPAEVLVPYIVKPNAKEVFEALLNKNFSIQAFRMMLDSQASEHGSRMSAMENATKNAGEMIKKLTLIYNKQRQAGITKELLEIISGSESQKSA